MPSKDEWLASLLHQVQPPPSIILLTCCLHDDELGGRADRGFAIFGEERKVAQDLLFWDLDVDEDPCAPVGGGLGGVHAMLLNAAHWMGFQFEIQRFDAARSLADLHAIHGAAALNAEVVPRVCGVGFELQRSDVARSLAHLHAIRGAATRIVDIGATRLRSRG